MIVPALTIVIILIANIHMGGSIDREQPSGLGYFMENPNLQWMIWGKSPIAGNHQIDLASLGIWDLMIGIFPLGNPEIHSGKRFFGGMGL